MFILAAILAAVNAATLEALWISFQTTFMLTLERTKTRIDELASTVPSSTLIEHYPMGALTGRMRPWTGDRVVQDLAAFLASVQNITFEHTVGVNREDIEDDTTGAYSLAIQQQAALGALEPWLQVMTELGTNAFSTSRGFDGVCFFNAQHVWPGMKEAAGAAQLNLTHNWLTAANVYAGIRAMSTFVGPDGVPLMVQPTHFLFSPELHRAGCSGRIVLRGTWSGAPAEVLARLGELNELCEQGLAAGVALEPVAGATYGHTLDAEIHSACNWFGARARSGGTPRWQYLEKTLERILWQQFRPSECGAGRGYYTVGPTGLIYACHKQQNSHIGLAWPQVVIDEVLRGQWLDNRFCSRKECSLCWARHVCGGACRSESLEFCGGVAQPHAGRCMLMRQIVTEALVLAATLPREALLRLCPAQSQHQPCAGGSGQERHSGVIATSHFAALPGAADGPQRAADGDAGYLPQGTLS